MLVTLKNKHVYDIFIEFNVYLIKLGCGKNVVS